MGRAAVRERGVVPACENRRRPPVTKVLPAVTHRIDAAMDRDEKACPATFLDQPLTQPHRDKLASGHNPILGLSQLPDQTGRFRPDRPLIPILNTFSIPGMEKVLRWRGA